MMKRSGWFSLTLCLAASVANAAAPVQPGPQVDAPTMPPMRAPPLRVQVSYQLAVPVNQDSVEEQKAAILSAHGALYAMAAQECERLRAVIPGDCRMTNLSLNNSAQFFNQQNQSMSFAANAVLELIPQLAAPAPTPAH